MWALEQRLMQNLYCVRSDLGNLLKAMGRLEEAKVSAWYLLGPSPGHVRVQCA